jgi:hypothetical protein
MAGFGNGIRSNVRGDFIRSVEQETMLQQVQARLLGIDYFSRNENVRLDSLRSAVLGGILDRESSNLELVLKDDVRR